VLAGAAGLAWRQLTTSNAAWEGLREPAPAPRATIPA
jgi:hypothetical protein